MTQEAQVIKWNCPCGNSYKFHGFTEAPQRPVAEPHKWVGLTKKEIEDEYHHVDSCGIGLEDFARAIESKLKEKNTK